MSYLCKIWSSRSNHQCGQLADVVFTLGWMDGQTSVQRGYYVPNRNAHVKNNNNDAYFLCLTVIIERLRSLICSSYVKLNA